MSLDYVPRNRALVIKGGTVVDGTGASRFIADIRIEERHYVREHRMLFLTRKCMVRQERIFFRNIPLSNWVEQEMPFEEGADLALDEIHRSLGIHRGQLVLVLIGDVGVDDSLAIVHRQRGIIGIALVIGWPHIVRIG